MANNNKALSAAGQAKKDEFYTQLVDIENELRHYKEHFKGKVVFCNCDDPYESNFFKYFAINFNHLGLKKLICTCYAGSPVVYTQLSLFGDEEVIGEEPSDKKPYKIEITHVDDLNGDGAVDLTDVELLLRSVDGKPTLLEGNGDFRSQECIELLKESDIVVTNPPFSLFREYVAQLVAYDKKFIIIGNQNAITYKEIFPLFKENRLWLGYGFKVGKICSKTGETVCINCCKKCENYFFNDAYFAHGCRYGVHEWHTSVTAEEARLNRIKAQIEDKVQLQERILNRGYRNDRKIANRIEGEITRLRYEASKIQAGMSL